MPIRFTVKDGETHFHYKTSDLMSFVRCGFRDGNVGMILTKRKGTMFTYRGFGTIESPSRDIFTMTISHCNLYDGNIPTDEQFLMPPDPHIDIKNVRFEIIGLSRG